MNHSKKSMNPVDGPRLLPLANVALHFWRTKDRAEVDFVLNFGSRVIPVEVKYATLAEPRIERSLRSFIAAYRPESALVVNKSFSGSLRVGETDVHFVPFWKTIQALQGMMKVNGQRAG